MRRSRSPHRTRHHHGTERAWGGANDLPHDQVLEVPIEPGPLLDALRQEGLVYAYDGNNVREVRNVRDAARILRRCLPQFDIPESVAQMHIRFMIDLFLQDYPGRNHPIELHAVLFQDACEKFGRQMVDEYEMPCRFPGYEVTFGRPDDGFHNTTYRLVVIPSHLTAFPYMLLLDGNLVDADRPHLRLGPYYRVSVGLTYEHVFDPTHDHLILHIRSVQCLHWHFRPNSLLKIARDVQMEQERLRRVHNAGARQLFRQKGVPDGILPQLGL
jgi:hypothetical protein